MNKNKKHEGLFRWKCFIFLWHFQNDWIATCNWNNSCFTEFQFQFQFDVLYVGSLYLICMADLIGNKFSISQQNEMFGMYEKENVAGKVNSGTLIPNCFVLSRQVFSTWLLGWNAWKVNKNYSLQAKYQKGFLK